MNRTNREADASTPKPQTMDNAESTLKTKLKQLERAKEKADEALKGEKQSAIQRKLTNLKEFVTEVDSARRTVEALKIEAKSTMEI